MLGSSIRRSRALMTNSNLDRLHHRQVACSREMPGNPCEPKAQVDRCDRSALRPVHPAWDPWAFSFRQWPIIRRHGRPRVDTKTG
jgi:hypothetical protein